MIRAISYNVVIFLSISGHPGSILTATTMSYSYRDEDNSHDDNRNEDSLRNCTNGISKTLSFRSCANEKRPAQNPACDTKHWNQVTQTFVRKYQRYQQANMLLEQNLLSSYITILRSDVDWSWKLEIVKALRNGVWKHFSDSYQFETSKLFTRSLTMFVYSDRSVLSGSSICGDDPFSFAWYPLSLKLESIKLLGEVAYQYREDLGAEVCPLLIHLLDPAEHELVLSYAALEVLQRIVTELPARVRVVLLQNDVLSSLSRLSKHLIHTAADSPFRTEAIVAILQCQNALRAPAGLADA